MKKVLVLLFSLVFGVLSVNARACTSDEISKINKEAENIKINYEIIEEKTKYKSEGEDEFNPSGFETEVVKDKIRITVYNITKNMFLLQSNDINSDRKTINYSDTTNGNYSFDVDDLYNLINYKFVVYSNLDCTLTEIKSINFVKPMRNSYYDYQVCQEHQNVPVCQKYVSSDVNVSESALYDYVTNYKSGNTAPNITSKVAPRDNENFFEANKLYILIGGGVVLIGVAAYLVISKKRSEL